MLGRFIIAFLLGSVLVVALLYILTFPWHFAAILALLIGIPMLYYFATAPAAPAAISRSATATESRGSTCRALGKSVWRALIIVSFIVQRLMTGGVIVHGDSRITLRYRRAGKGIA